MTEKQIDYLADFLDKGGCEYKRGLLLCSCSSFKIGGAADIAIYPSSRGQLAGLIMQLMESGIRHDVFGNCTNVLFDDDGYRGAAVFTSKLRSVELEDGVIKADSGCPLSTVALYAAKNSLEGIEFAYGIPGSVGGAVFMNAGAFERQISDILLDCHALDEKTGEAMLLNRGECAFSYRHSVFMDKSLTVLGAEFALKAGDEAEINARMDDYLARRREKQPLEYPSAGSVFKRCPGHFTGKLIEDAGLKGSVVGGAEVSTKHAGFIINKGGASSSDVLALIDHIKNEIKRRYGLDIECEVRYVPAEV